MPDTLTWSPTSVNREPPPVTPATPELHVHDALPAATRLDEFEIIRVLGAGGFGIVYLALDHVLLRYVAIKEYMPAALAGRGPGESVSVRSPSHAQTYAIGLESFFNEARMLASFDHPSLVKVHRFWKANGTAYMAMQYYPGRTLREVRGELGGAPDETWLRAIVDPLLGALEALHGEDIYHRDIAPDNILLLPDGRPVLLDFGSARRVIGDRTQSLTAILKPNFAPVEQYADEPGMRQGPWTDLYALGATVHFVLTGQVPVPAVLRAVRDTMVAVSDPASGPYPGVGQAFLATIDWTLALAPEDRPQSISTLRRGLSGEIQPPPPGVRLKPAVALPTPAFDVAAAAPPHADAYAPTKVLAPPPVHPLPASAPLSAPPAATAHPPTVRLTPREPEPAAAAAPLQRRRVVVTTLAGLVVAAAALAGIARWFSAPASTASVAVAVPAPMPASAVVPTLAAAEIAAPVVNLPPPAAEAAPASVVVVAAAASAVHKEPVRRSEKPTAEARARPAPPPAVVAVAAEVQRPAATERPPAAAPKSPKELCGDLNFVALAMCVSRQCEAPALQSHPQCVEARRYDEQRRRRMEQ